MACCSWVEALFWYGRGMKRKLRGRGIGFRLKLNSARFFLFPARNWFECCFWILLRRGRQPFQRIRREFGGLTRLNCKRSLRRLIQYDRFGVYMRCRFNFLFISNKFERLGRLCGVNGLARPRPSAILSPDTGVAV